MEKDSNRDRYNTFRQIGLTTMIPVLLVCGPLVGLGLGKLLDRVFHTSPILMYVGLVLGFIAAGNETYKIIRQLSEKK